jgi:thiosulfate/3-mercaptopyruvate sulfurtransferase
MSMRCCLFVLLLASLRVALPAQEMIVSGNWLAERLADPQVVVLHVGTAKDYEEGHIPGARLLTIEDITVTGPTGLRTELPRVDALVSALGKVGVSDTNRIVIYSGTPEIQSATRAWFTLDYLGLGNRASMLDGNLALWKKEGRPLSKEPAPPANSTFTARPSPSRVVSAEWLQMHRTDPSVLRIDARTPEYYSGADKGTMVRAGHLPGAINTPFTSYFDEDGRWKSREELQRLLRVGTSAAEPVRVSYCHVGRQATVPYFAGRLLGLDMRVFDGSFQEWSSRKEFPVETSALPADAK